MERWLVILIALAIIIMGEPLAAAFLLLGYEVGYSHGKPPIKHEKPPEPVCLGTYPFLNPQDQAERDCGTCLYAQECYEETPHPMARSRKRRNA